MGREISIGNPAIQSLPLLQKGYTPDGMISFLNNGRGYYTTFYYDGFNRLSSSQYLDGTTETAKYDNDGNLIQRKSRKGDIYSLAYDTLNRLCTKTLAQQVTPCNGTSSFIPTYWYNYDINGRITSARDNDVSSTLTPSSPSSPSVVDRYETLYAYDNLNRLIGIDWNPTASANPSPSATAVTLDYAYNKANQVISETATDGSWLNYPISTSSTTGYTANILDQYTAVGSVNPKYDQNGNVIYNGNFNYGYDAEGRLICVSQGPNCSTPTATYGYDARGRLKLSSVAGTKIVYVTDAENRQVLEYDGGNGQVQRWFTVGLGQSEIISRTDVAAGTRATHIPDVEGSVVGILDSASGALKKIGYSPFGKSNAAPEP